MDRLSRIANALEAAAAKDDPPEKTEREKADLRAQQDMAYWACLMFAATAVQVILTGVGIYYIRRTLQQNRVATDAAVMAARAADASVEVASDTAKRQLRAYVGVTNCNVLLTPNNDGIFGIATIKNTGQTPASKLRVWAMIDIINIAAKDAFATPPNIKYGGTSAIFAGGDSQVRRSMAVNAAQLDGIKNSQNQIVFWGGIDYVDIFDQAQQWEFRLMAVGAPHLMTIQGKEYAGWTLHPPQRDD